MSQINIALVCDFFHPSFGGVETHIKQLSMFLKEQVKKVIVITHYEKNHYGTHILDGVKVYYLPWHHSYTYNVIFGTFILEFPQARAILKKENINIVHCHQTASFLSLDYGLFALALGLKVVLTQHSLYGYKSIPNIALNAFLKRLLHHFDQIICVSRATRNNIILRTSVHADKTIIIPNAVETIEIEKVLSKSIETIKIVVVGRLVFRRGTDLLIDLIPTLCQRNHRVQLIVVGNGNKFAPLCQMVKVNKLEARVKLMGALSNSQTLKIVKGCHIFLSPALTESFGIALVEAATLGLHCISTNVGGVKEILPSNRLHIVEPTKNEIIMKLQQIIDKIKNERSELEPFRSPYSINKCFGRVLKVYQNVLEQKRNPQLAKRFCKQFFRTKSIASLFLFVVVVLIRLMDFALNLRENENKTEIRN